MYIRRNCLTFLCCIKETVHSAHCSVVVRMSCKLHHPFTVVVAGPTGSGKSKWVLQLIDLANEIIKPPPTKIWYCYGKFQPTFNNYPRVDFQEGLPELSDRVFDGLESTPIILDNLMSETNQLVANMFTKISYYRNVSVVYLTQNVKVCDRSIQGCYQCSVWLSADRPETRTRRAMSFENEHISWRK